MQRPLLLLGQAPLGERLVVTARLGGRFKSMFVLNKQRKAPEGSCRVHVPVVALAEGGGGLDNMPSAACSAASLPFFPALRAFVHMSTTRDRLTAEGEAAATAPAHSAHQASSLFDPA